MLGYTSLYPPQEEAIRRGVEYGRSLLVATPTASGKTFIGMTAIVNRLLDNPGGRAVYLAPLRSIAQQKYSEMQKLQALGLTTGLSIGDLVLGSRRPHVLITTYEKFDSTLRVDPTILERLSVLVIDEVHYVGEPKRGVVLESLVARVLSKAEPQVVALSATVPNVEEIAEWLGAEPIVMDWRPVPLREAVFHNYKLYYPREGRVEEVPRVTGKPYLDMEIATSAGGGQSLVFAMSRRRAVQLARQAAKHSRQLQYDEVLAKEAARRILRESGGPASIREELAKLVVKGVAYHHAGLNNQQRSIIEETFLKGGIASIHATPTLAAGVNLPARTVIVEEYYRYEEGLRRPIPVFEYKQLAGRAGRPGFDEYGLAVIIAKGSTRPEEIAEVYILGGIEPVRSRLNGMRGLRHILLGLIASENGVTLEDVQSFASRTLYARQSGWRSLRLYVERALGQLADWGLISAGNGHYRPTILGLETAKAYLDPESIPLFRRIVERIHSPPPDYVLLYAISRMPDAVTLVTTRREAEKLVDTMIERHPDLIELVEWFGPEEARAYKTMLLLEMWINEKSEDEIYQALGAQPGDIASVTETASWISRSLARIAQVMRVGFNIPERLTVLSARIKYGVKQELLLLIVIPGIGRVRARRLYSAGYKTLADLAAARPEDLMKIQGIGPTIVKNILEFLGRREEAKKIKTGEGLEAFL